MDRISGPSAHAAHFAYLRALRALKQPLTGPASRAVAAGIPDGLRELLDRAAGSAGGHARDRAAWQSSLDASTDQIRLAERLVEEGGADWAPFRVVQLSPDVSAYGLHEVHLPSGEELSVEVEVRTSAQPAGLFLAFDGPAWSAGTIASTLTLQISGPEGQAQLVFISGSSLASITAAISSIGEPKGVRAVEMAGGIRLESVGHGSGNFVSIQRLHGPAAAGDGLKVYDLLATDFNRPDYTTGQPAGSAPRRDLGQDVRALINGVGTGSRGEMVELRLPGVEGWLRLTTGAATGAANAQTVGKMTAFRIIGHP